MLSQVWKGVDEPVLGDESSGLLSYSLHIHIIDWDTFAVLIMSITATEVLVDGKKGTRTLPRTNHLIVKAANPDHINHLPPPLSEPVRTICIDGC